MSSIVLEPGVKEMLVADCRDFLNSEEWYVLSPPHTHPLLPCDPKVCVKCGIDQAVLSLGMLSEVRVLNLPLSSEEERRLISLSGIPFRRGYLLHGVPGR